MKVEIDNNVLVIAIENPKMVSGWQYSRITIPPKFSEQRNDFVSSFVGLCSGKAIKTQVSLYQTVLLPFFKYLSEKHLNLPTKDSDSGWTLFLVNFFIFYLTDTKWGNRSLKTRINGWRNCMLLLNLLKERRMIPLHVPVPKLVDRNQQVAFEYTRQNVVGQNSSTNAKDPEHNNRENINKLVLDLSYAKDSDAYLEDIEIDLSHRIKAIDKICSDHWTTMKAIHQSGRELISQISQDQLKNVLSNNLFRVKIAGTYRNRTTYLTNARNKDGVAWSLALLNHTLLNSNDPNALASSKITQYPFFASSVSPLPFLKRQLCALGGGSSSYFSVNVIHRHLGLLHVTDCAAACALLTIDHPQFTSESLQECKLLTVNNKYHLITTDESDYKIFSVDKPRAKNIKRVVLTPRSKSIVDYIIKMTEPIRNIMKRNGDPNWRYLFLVSSNGILKASSNRVIMRALNDINGLSLYRLYRESFQYNTIASESLTLSRIRNTMGVLEWFKTGQVRSMSKKLGNSERVCLEHYIPPWLLKKWNERLVRRFQQTLILLAAHNEPYLLEVSDFSTVSDLVSFITQRVVTTQRGSDPISDAISDRLSPKTNKLEYEDSVNSELGVNLSPESLCILYTFSDWAKDTLTEQEIYYKDPVSGISPYTLIQLSTLLSHMIGSQSDDPVDNAIRSHVQGDSAKNLSNIHEKALWMLPEYRKRFNSFSVSKSKDIA